MLRYCKDFDDVEVTLRVVANDPTLNVRQALPLLKIPYTVYNDLDLNDYYLNRVYRCWNYCAKSSEADLICFINSDMAFSENWLKPLVDLHKNNYLPVARLVESGKIKSGTHGYTQNFGRHPKEFNEQVWLDFVKYFSKDEVHEGGLHMPVVFDKWEFILAGSYPEGNVLWPGTPNEVVGSRAYEALGGDYIYFKRFTQLTGRKHATAFNSVVYHIQEGELDS